jgi:integrase
MRTDYINPDLYKIIFLHMTYDNALALEVSLHTGMRIGDVLKIRPDDVQSDGIHYVAEKTGKAGVAPISRRLADKLLRNGNRWWCFPHRDAPRLKHRTRQAVWKDVKRAAQLVRMDGLIDDQNVAPHSGRKTFAVVDKAQHGADHAQTALQHSSRSTTEIYTESDKLVGVPPSYRDNTEVLRRLNTLDKKVDTLLSLLRSCFRSGSA